MAILWITKDNWELFCDELIDLSDEFLQLVCHQNPRTATASREVLAAMVATSNTLVLLCQDDSGVGVGISYFNFGSGYSCGGRYLWINCIYIRSGFRQQGDGTRMLEAIEQEGRRRGITLMVCSRDRENAGSRQLLARAGFRQEDQVVATKQID